jgi:mannose-6-phosphate isomerase class I
MLSVISVKQGTAFESPRNRSVEILICMEGEADIADPGTGEALALTRGRSVIIPAGVSQYRIEGTATLYKATVPL